MIIPEGVKSIGERTFAGCSNLSSVTLPASVTSIGWETFRDCTSLTRISLLDGVTSLNNRSFDNCTAIKYANIGSAGAKTLSKAGHVFRAPGTNYNLKYIYSGSEITGLEALEGDASATEVTLPAEVTRIANSGFANCQNLGKLCVYGMTTTFGSDILPWDCLPTVYCYEFSDAEGWAIDNGYPVVLLDGMDIDSHRTVSLPERLLVKLGETKPLEAAVFPDENPEIAWSISDSTIASIENGMITGLKPGTATVTATVGSKSASMAVVVYHPAESFELNHSEIWLAAKQPLQLSAVNMVPEGSEVDLTWKSSDTAYATVNASGYVTTKKPGDVTITATSESGISRECLIHLCYPVTTIAFEPETITLKKGQSCQMTAYVTARTQSFVNKLVTFETSNAAVATVDADGRVTAKGVGTATITATAANGVSASCEIIVQESPTLTLPTSLIAIEAEAFMGDGSLESVIIPDGCTTIGSRAFADCPNLIYVKIPASVTSIADDAFEGSDQVRIDREE